VPDGRLPTLAELAALVDRRAKDDSAAARLQAAIELGGELSGLSDDLVGRFVADARAAGLSWADIGRRFGTSKQAAQQRYGAPSVRADRWTAAAQTALARASAEAEALRHGHVGTEHVLLALAGAEHDPAAEVLRELGVTCERLLTTGCLEPRLGGRTAAEDAVVLPRLKQALDHGRRIADGLGAPLAGGEHLLAGIVAVPDSMAVEMLRRLGVSAGTVRAALATRLGVEPRRLGVPRQRGRRLPAVRRRSTRRAA
jgi:Clp amino terminal domain, pathogenicity island component